MIGLGAVHKPFTAAVVCYVLCTIAFKHDPFVMSTAAAFVSITTIRKSSTCWGKPVRSEALISRSVVSSNKKDASNNDDVLSSSRRSALEKIAYLIPTISAAEIVLLSRTSLAEAAEETTPVTKTAKKTIIITGCNSGIGLDAAIRLATSSTNHRVILACRTMEKAENAVRQVIQQQQQTGDIVPDLIPIECDLASLNSITSFAQRVSSILKQDGGTTKIDVLALNAGISRNIASKDVTRTIDGFEMTIGTNHLGHFYLTNLLLPFMDAKTGRIVVTASGVHDPESPGGAQGSKASLGNLKGFKNQGPSFEMVDGGTFDPDKAYKDSKLCNVLFTRELQRQLDEKGYNIKANCFNPGLIVGTGLFRDQNQLFTKVFDIAATNILKVGETTHWGGGCLEYLCIDNQVGSRMGGQYYTSVPGSSKYGDAAYGKQFGITQVSKEARDDEKAKELWTLSATLVGIPSYCGFDKAA